MIIRPCPALPNINPVPRSIVTTPRNRYHPHCSFQLQLKSLPTTENRVDEGSSVVLTTPRIPTERHLPQHCRPWAPRVLSVRPSSLIRRPAVRLRVPVNLASRWTGSCTRPAQRLHQPPRRTKGARRYHLPETSACLYPPPPFWWRDSDIDSLLFGNNRPPLSFSLSLSARHSPLGCFTKVKRLPHCWVARGMRIRPRGRVGGMSSDQGIKSHE